MRLPIDIKRCGLHSMWDGNRWLMAALLAYALLWLGHGSANAQIASSNPLEYVADSIQQSLGVCRPCRG